MTSVNEELLELRKELLDNNDHDFDGDLGTGLSKAVEMASVSKDVTIKDINPDFEPFLGYWKLENISMSPSSVLQRFYYDEFNTPMIQLYYGTYDNYREATVADKDTARTTFIDRNIDKTEVVVVDNTGLYFAIDPTITFKIQSGDAKVGYFCYIDNIELGVLLNTLKYIKLDQEPEILKTDEEPVPANKWENPVNMFTYLFEYMVQVSNTQKADSLNQTQYIGFDNMVEAYDAILTTGVERKSKVSTKWREGVGYIGVWTTNNPFSSRFNVTTIHTEGPHKFNPASTVVIEGFKNEYSVLNGTQEVGFIDGLPIGGRIGTEYPYVLDRSTEYFFYIIYDSSDITVKYDPNIHGVATVTSQVGPVTPETEYKDFMSAAYDFYFTTFGAATHNTLATRLRYLNGRIPETWSDLVTLMSENDTIPRGVRARTFCTKSNHTLYWNPRINSGNAFELPPSNVNDPFGLGFMSFSSKYNYDIDLENYLDKTKTFNVFWKYNEDTEGQPIIFRANDFGVPPGPEWNYYRQNKSSSGRPNKYTNGLLVGGIINRKYTSKHCCKKHCNNRCNKLVAYIRIIGEELYKRDFTIDELLNEGRTDMESKFKSNAIAAMASLVSKLNTVCGRRPDRFIIDSRPNEGGIVYVAEAFAACFGGDRQGASLVYNTFGGDGSQDPAQILGSGIETVNNSIDNNAVVGNKINVTEAENVFGSLSIVKNAELIILTTSNAKSGGDILPHCFISEDKTTTLHDIGNGVKAAIVGDIDGRLFNVIRRNDIIPINSVNPVFKDAAGEARGPFFLRSDAGYYTCKDVNGFYVNECEWVRPHILLPSWYDDTLWPDLGFIDKNIKEFYPLKCKKGNPKEDEPETWRDSFLEHAIVDKL